MIDFDSHPAILPPGYRLRTRFALLPIEVAGRRRWLERIRIVQRGEDAIVYNRVGGVTITSLPIKTTFWQDVGYWEEIMPTLGKARAGVGWSENP